VGAPGNVQARGLNPAQPSDQKYAAGHLKVPYCMCLIRHSAAGKVSYENGCGHDRLQLLKLNLFVGLPMVMGTVETLPREVCLDAKWRVEPGEDPADIWRWVWRWVFWRRISIPCDVERQLVTVRFGSRVTAQEIGEYVQKLRDHPSFQSTFSEIVDLREAKDIE